MKCARFAALAALPGVVVFAGVTLALPVRTAVQKPGEEKRDVYREWLQKDVLYIISQQEKEVFSKLTTDAERDRFIEEFWRSRDPTPDAPPNEFKEEHYRRLAYANEHFSAGKPGWKTDRGMIYIKFGPPDRRETNPTGGRYYRTPQELVASDSKYPEQHMTALPWEVWEYRSLPHLGQEVSFEFVAKDGSPDYTLAMTPDEKDALFFNTGSNLPREADRDRGLRTFRSSPLDKLEDYFSATQPLPYEPPKTFVSAEVRFSEMPFEIRAEVDGSVQPPMVELRVTIPNSSLNFNKRSADYYSRVETEIFVRDIRKLVVAHRAEALESTLPGSELAAGLLESSLYATKFPLPPGRYLFEVWIRDVLGDTASFNQQLVVVPESD